MIIDCDTHILPRDSYERIEGALAALATPVRVMSPVWELIVENVA